MLRRTFWTLSSPRKIQKVLVANRGEIACRVFKTCNQMGIRTVAVYCDAESSSKHVQFADEAVRIGSPPASTSYLRGDVIIDAAKRLGVDAIHPGYGFLSENAEFSEAVTKAGIAFIGPPAEAIVSMGSKSESKIIMTKANVPVVPGYHGENQCEQFLAAEAEKVGFPLLIKAVSGGGGKGMKIVRSKEDFGTLLSSAKREATNFFKDDRVLLEKFIERPRHIECQIFCDGQGGNVFFFERDCSVQRRYQKVLEEAPAPYISEEKRQEIGAVAVKAAEAVGYIGAGTVEFIFDTDSKEFYFMEMNTRLQVEHPVTEEICRIKGEPVDLVRLQIETAEGKRLKFSQKDLQIVGSCIEARVFAENPRDNFLPGSGHLAFVEEPAEGTFGDMKVRVDTGFRSGDDVLVHYDPMIAKLIVWGANRDIALRGLRKSLDEYHIVGIQTNIDFLKACCEHDEFVKGGVTTKFIEENQSELLKPVPLESTTVALIALSRALKGGLGEGAFRLNHRSNITIPLLDADGNNVPVSVSQEGYDFVVSGQGFTHRISPAKALRDGFSAAHIDGSMRIEYKPVVLDKQVAVLTPAGTFAMRLLPLPMGFGDVKYEAGGSKRVLTPMPGKVAKFLVPEGTNVVKGQNVLIVEAMKMEHLVKSPCDGTIHFVVKEGHMAASDDVLAEFASEE